jgi:hypothetical protein
MRPNPMSLPKRRAILTSTTRPACGSTHRPPTARRDIGHGRTFEIITLKQRLAWLVDQQWRHEATLRSLDNPDPIPVRWELIARTEVMDHPANIEDGAVGGEWWSVSSADIAGLGARFRARR